MDPTVETKPWLTFLDKEASNTSAQDFVPDVANILKNYLISKTENNNALETAKKIDSYSVPSPYMHLSSVYWMIFDTAAVIPYNDATQEKLLNLLIEMLRLPRRKFETQAGEIAEERPIYYEEFFNIFNESWNARHVDELDLDTKTQDEYTQACIEWVNISAFFARCYSAGLEKDSASACKFPENDIPEALESKDSYVPGIDTDFRVMVATQYIVIAGDKIMKVSAKFWEGHSDVWEKKLQELEDWYENGFPEVIPRYEIPPGEKELIGTGDLGMDVLSSVKAASKKLKEMQGVLKQESNEDLAEGEDE
ncbi:hypothetical protein BCIN_09g01030 [Botrytis cinerea B05.10]|uniref:Uncharacterized protein n=1 Tax=Botryotinia fuckeliana (strain B05.10) TaxID=332648 RepID=A0A384JRL1_BOTFB|nr:hypothetical protein BCIN_09g01030 [Botrytis cinerea B05.10]ATZ53225.1 hypothetical protein BCIN_09g01030 [Botrytis cinerea B05.10]